MVFRALLVGDVELPFEPFGEIGPDVFRRRYLACCLEGEFRQVHSIEFSYDVGFVQSCRSQFFAVGECFVQRLGPCVDDLRLEFFEQRHEGRNLCLIFPFVSPVGLGCEVLAIVLEEVEEGDMFPEVLFLLLVDAVFGLEHVACEVGVCGIFKPVLRHRVEKRVHLEAVGFAQFVVGLMQTDVHLANAVGRGAASVGWAVGIEAHLMDAEHQRAPPVQSLFVVSAHSRFEVVCCHVSFFCPANIVKKIRSGNILRAKLWVKRVVGR